MSLRSRLAVVGFGVLVAACGGDSDRSEVSGAGVAPTSEVAVDAVADDETAGTTAESESEVVPAATNMTDLLATVPLSAHEMIVGDPPAGFGRSGFELLLVDLNATSALAGLERPDPIDVDASEAWLTEVFEGQSVSAGGHGLYFPGVSKHALAERSVSQPEFGFSILEADRFVTLIDVPLVFTAIQGENVSLAPTLVESGAGVFSTGAGEDFEADYDSISALRPDWVPYRLAGREGAVAVSQSTPAVEDWLAGGPSLTAVPELAEAARVLDAAGSVSALVTMGWLGSLYSDDDGRQSFGFAAPFRAAGIGIVDVDGRPGTAIVYVFDDEASAAVVLPELDVAWRTGTTPRGTRYTELVNVSSVDQSGRSVVVVTTPVTGTTLQPFTWLRVHDPILSIN